MSALPPAPQPSWRKPFGMLMIVGIIIVWAGIVGSFSRYIGQWPMLAQIIVYVVAGIVWIVPLKPLLAWMETGRWRPKASDK